MGLSNYPPGVSGHEPQITGETAPDEADVPEPAMVTADCGHTIPEDDVVTESVQVAPGEWENVSDCCPACYETAKAAEVAGSRDEFDLAALREEEQLAVDAMTDPA